jgi:hypothetical protein
MSSNGKQTPRGRAERSRIGDPASTGPMPFPQIEIKQAAASPEEAAAIAAAVEQFLRDTGPAPVPPETVMSPWLEAGLLESTGREPDQGAPWGKLSPGTLL